MSTPKSAKEAAKVAALLLKRALPGHSPRARAKWQCAAARVAVVIWHRWRVGPWQWQCKQIRWFLEYGTAGYSAWTRYRYWLTVKRLLQVIGKWNDWRAQLTGPWCKP